MTARNKRILVIGATGQQGLAATRHLLKAGWDVRGLTRDRSKPSALQLIELGATVVEGDLNDASSLARAMRDCYGVFCVLTFVEEGVQGEVRQGQLIAQTAADNSIQHFVYSSVGSADQKTGIPHFDSKWRVEEAIREVKLPATILRPVWFMDNFRNWYAEPMLKTGQLKLPIRPDKPLQMIAVEDIGRVAADCFNRTEEYLGKAIDLAGDELTLPQAATLMGSALGRRVTYVRQDITEVRAQNPDYAAMFEWFNQHGYHADTRSLRAQFPYLMTLADYLIWSGWERLRLQREPAVSGRNS